MWKGSFAVMGRLIKTKQNKANTSMPSSDFECDLQGHMCPLAPHILFNI